MIEITLDEAKEVYRFLETLATCEYKGVVPVFDDVTADDLGAIAHAIWMYIREEENA